MAVDASAATFWASKYDVVGPVSFTADLGKTARANELEVAWAFPPKSFAVHVSPDGSSFVEVYSTDSNVLSTSVVPLMAGARFIKVIMSEARCCASV